MTTAETIERVTASFHSTGDLLTREICVNGTSCALFYIDGLSDKMLLEQDVIAPLSRSKTLFSSESLSDEQVREELLAHLFFCQDVPVLPYDGAVAKIAEGDVALFADGRENFFVFSLRKFEKRAVAEPPTATVLKGPREGFIEEIKTNCALIRRRIKSPDLVFENLNVGRYSSTPVSVVYVDGIAEKDVVEAVKDKLSRIEIDGVVDSAYLASFLEPSKFSLFKRVGNSEKPDVVAAKLLEGRVAVLADGSPIALTLPFILLEDMQDAYDYYSGDWKATFARLFRLMGALLTVMLPAAYVALQSAHYHLLPLKFLMTIVGATAAIPFPPAIEMLVVLLLFEILNEASVRMPRYLGVSLSIVGAIVLGDTAVKAGLISSPAVLVTALSSIGVFCVPDQVGTLSVLRLLFLCVSAVLGLFGIIVFGLCLIAYLACLSSFGAPYLAPYAPRISPDLKDGAFVAPVSEMFTRPYSVPSVNRTRMKPADAPDRERNGETSAPSPDGAAEADGKGGAR